MYYTADKETGTIIEKVSTVADGLNLIREYEKNDRASGTYEVDFYDVVDEDHCSVL